MEDEFLLFVIASFAEKFFRISKNNSSFFLFYYRRCLLYSRFFPFFIPLENGRRKEERSYFVLFSPPHFFSLFLAFTPAKKDVSSR